MNENEELEMRERKAAKKRRKKIIIAVIRLLLIILIFALIIKAISSCANRKKEPTASYESYNNYNAGDGEEEFSEKLKSLDQMVKGLSSEEMLKDFSIYTGDKFVELNDFENIYGIRGVTFIKEHDEQNQYNEITIVRCEKEEEQDAVLLKLLARYENIKKEKLDVYGKELSNIKNFSLERIAGTTVFILSHNMQNYKNLIYSNYINY